MQRADPVLLSIAREIAQPIRGLVDEIVWHRLVARIADALQAERDDAAGAP